MHRKTQTNKHKQVELVSINSNNQDIKLVSNSNSNSIRLDRYGTMVIRNSRNGTKKCSKIRRIITAVQRKIIRITIILINLRLLLLLSQQLRIASSSRNSRIKGKPVQRNSKKLGTLSKELIETIISQMIMDKRLVHLVVQWI